MADHGINYSYFWSAMKWIMFNDYCLIIDKFMTLKINDGSHWVTFCNSIAFDWLYVVDDLNQVPMSWEYRKFKWWNYGWWLMWVSGIRAQCDCVETRLQMAVEAAISGLSNAGSSSHVSGWLIFCCEVLDSDTIKVQQKKLFDQLLGKIGKDHCRKPCLRVGVAGFLWLS